PCRFGTRSTGVAWLHHDGSAGVTPSHPDQPATLITQPFPVTGNELRVNLEQRGAGGAVEVSLLDEDRRSIPDHGLDDADPITNDSVRHRVTWKRRGVPLLLVGRPVRLQIRVRGKAVLYTMATSPPNPGPSAPR